MALKKVLEKISWVFMVLEKDSTMHKLASKVPETHEAHKT